jgi:hypothetical protein
MIVYFFRDGKMFDKSAEKTANRELKLKMIEKQKLNLTSEVFCQDLPSSFLITTRRDFGLFFVCEEPEAFGEA